MAGWAGLGRRRGRSVIPLSCQGRGSRAASVTHFFSNFLLERDGTEPNRTNRAYHFFSLLLRTVLSSVYGTGSKTKSRSLPFLFFLLHWPRSVAPPVVGRLSCGPLSHAHAHAYLRRNSGRHGTFVSGTNILPVLLLPLPQPLHLRAVAVAATRSSLMASSARWRGWCSY